jgi:hypothetical protein
VILETSADESHAIGQQCRGHCVAHEADQATPIEFELDRICRIDQSARCDAS